MRRRPLVVLAILAVACGRESPDPKPDLIATHDACLAEYVYQQALETQQRAPTEQTEAFVAYARARWRAYAAHDSAVNHSRKSPGDSIRHQHHATLHLGAAQARDRRMRASNLGTYYAESLADAAASPACRSNSATETAAQ